MCHPDASFAETTSRGSGRPPHLLVFVSKPERYASREASSITEGRTWRLLSAVNCQAGEPAKQHCVERRLHRLRQRAGNVSRGPPQNPLVVDTKFEATPV